MGFSLSPSTERIGDCSNATRLFLDAQTVRETPLLIRAAFDSDRDALNAAKMARELLWEDEEDLRMEDFKEVSQT